MLHSPTRAVEQYNPAHDVSRGTTTQSQFVFILQETYCIFKHMQARILENYNFNLRKMETRHPIENSALWESLCVLCHTVVGVP